MDVIGLPISRRDGRLKVTGGAKYAAEFKQPGMAYAVIVKSTIANGTIDTIDTGAAMALPGVLAVMTPDNAPRLNLRKAAPQSVLAPLLQDRAVRYNGSHVAVAVADTQERAFAAAAAVRVTYRAAAAVTMMDAALGTAYPPKHFRGGSRSPDSRRGDPDQAFATAPVQVNETYTTPIEHHNPMELHATIARWDGDRLTVWTATQGVIGAHDTLAALFDLAPENVHVIDPFVGGGFGTKGNAWPPLTLAAMAARLVGRPVRLELTRAQMFTSNGYRPRTIQTVRLAADHDGRLLALRHDGISQNGAAELGEYSEPVALASEMLYAVENNAVSHRIVDVNQGLPTYMRAPGEAPGVFALEVAMDELAVKLGMDPVELRLRNYAETDGHEDKPFSAKKLRECYMEGAAAFGWSARKPEPRAMRDGRWLVGWGMATSTYPMNRSPASARVTLHPDGTVLVQSATQDIGTGTYTILSQVAAQAFGVPVTRVRVELGNSAFPRAPVSGGSMTVASVGPAVQAAAFQVRDRLFGMAARLWQGARPARMRLAEGVVSGPDGRVSVAELLAREGQGSLTAEAHTDPGDAKEHYSLHSFGAQFAEAKVNEDTGEVRISRWVGAFDAGRIMNPRTARSQAIGGIVFGIGMALLEETRTDARTGRYTNMNVAEYLMPVNADIPDIRTILVANDDPRANPLGARGIGELPMVGTAAAVANAVYHATGKRLRDLPIRPEHLLA